MDGYIIGAIALFVVSSGVVLAGVMGLQRYRREAAGNPSAVAPSVKGWLLPSMFIDALAAGLLVLGLTR